MKKCIIYSITIYLIITMLLLLQKPPFLYDQYGNIKSMNYLKYKLQYGFNQPEELICFPTILIISSILSYFLAKSLIN
jgi:hypothetical protein